GMHCTRRRVAPGSATLADGVLWVALPLLAVQLTRSPILIAGVTVAARLPWLLAPAAGAFAHRLDRRVAGRLGVGGPLFDTSAQSLLPAVVGRDDLTRANSRLFAVELVANEFIGPPVGGLRSEEN